MTDYIIKTIFYTSGVVGLLLIAYVFAKSCLNGTTPFNKKAGNLQIEESLVISPRKTLHIVRAFDEKFLVASDANSTTLLAKLSSSNDDTPTEVIEEFKSLVENNQPENSTKKTESILHSMLEKLNN